MPYILQPCFKWHNPCINKAIHMILLHRFGTLNILVLDHYILRQLICFGFNMWLKLNYRYILARPKIKLLFPLTRPTQKKRPYSKKLFQFSVKNFFHFENCLMQTVSVIFKKIFLADCVFILLPIVGLCSKTRKPEG